MSTSVFTPEGQIIRGRYRLEDLLEKMPEDYEPAEEDWGPPVGSEDW